MNQSFTAASATYSALAAQILGWTPDAFWFATPAELTASLSPLPNQSNSLISLDEITQLIERENNG